LYRRFGSFVPDQRLNRPSRRAVLFGAPAAALAACSTKPVVFASDTAIQSVAYQHPGPKYVQLMSMFNTGTNNGAHTALVINASQRVIFDPAGDFAHSKIPERHDVLYGANPRVLKGFFDCHARATFWASLQYVEVSPQSAERALRRVQSLGPQPDAYCTRAVSNTLAELPEFNRYIRPTWFPGNLHEQMRRVPGMIEQELREDDDPDKHTCIKGLAL